MDTNDSNIKSQQTGGLKLMTVFIAVLALHVVVIGGFTVYHLMSGGADADLTTTDKTHKDLKGADGSMMADGTLVAAGQGDKSASASTPPTDTTTTPANPATDQVVTTEITGPMSAPAEASAPAPTLVPAPTPVLAPSPALTLTAPKPALAPPAEVATPGPQTPTGPISPELNPTAEAVSAPSASWAAGPVHMPPVESSPAAPRIEREHQQIYTVKITDSYKKIAHSHHVTVAQLKEANHIKGDTLHTGQKLIIPSSGPLVAATVSAADLDSTPTTTVLNESIPAATANLAAASSTVAATGAQHHLYTIVKGDTLSKIARKFKTTASALMSENSITDPTKLTIGKKLRIPSSESRSARNSAPPSTQPGQIQAKEKETENASSADLANFVP